MIKSMTGYGRGNAASKGKQITVTVRAVNFRFLDLKIRGLELDPSVDNQIRNRLTQKMDRGNIQVNLSITGTSVNKNNDFDKSRFETLSAIVLMIQKKYGKNLDISKILNSDDLLKSEPINDYSPGLIMKALDQAITQADEMRNKEGQKISVDILERVEIIKETIEFLEKALVHATHDRLELYKTRLKTLLEDVSLDENRVLQEIAIMAEKYDITEEIVRCRSHFEQFIEFVNLDEPVGKRLNFLLQEINREINTIGSKSSDSGVIKHVVNMKNEAEKIREQIQNIL